MPTESTIFKVCSYLRNFFDRGQIHYFGVVVVENGALAETYSLKPQQYFRIVGSTLNDGVYKYPVTELDDESFSGGIIGMAIPKAVLDIMDKIESWENKYATVSGNALSPFNSESFGGYSYSKSTGATDTSKDKSGTWQGTFGAELQPWRKI